MHKVSLQSVKYCESMGSLLLAHSNTDQPKNKLYANTYKPAQNVVYGSINTCAKWQENTYFEGTVDT